MAKGRCLYVHEYLPSPALHVHSLCRARKLARACLTVEKETEHRKGFQNSKQERWWDFQRGIGRCSVFKTACRSASQLGITWKRHIRVMKLCAMLKDARNCVVTFTDWPIDLVESSPSSAVHHKLIIHSIFSDNSSSKQAILDTAHTTSASQFSKLTRHQHRNDRLHANIITSSNTWTRSCMGVQSSSGANHRI